MRIGIIGAGFTGLSAGLRLAQAGHKVEIFEAQNQVGGLASGFSEPSWEWPLEHFYHHIFSNDSAIIGLASEIGWPARFYRPKTSLYAKDKIYAFDSAAHLLRYPHLSLLAKLRMGAVLAFLKLNPFWKPLERITADAFLNRSMGPQAYQEIWEPLLKSKFSEWYEKVNAAWFWARIQKRTPKLGYFENGFQGLANKLQDAIYSAGGKLHLNSAIKQISASGKKLKVALQSQEKYFDSVLVTVNPELFVKLVPDLGKNCKNRFERLESLDALVAVLVLNKPVSEEYWINITDSNLPFLVMVEHTNLIDARHYGGNHIIYLGAYLDRDHRFFRLSCEKLTEMGLEQLKRVFDHFEKETLVKSFVFRGNNAQPVFPVNYSSLKPDMSTPINNLFLANMNLVYPWDRGTNYAVELGERAARLIVESIK